MQSGSGSSRKDRKEGVDWEMAMAMAGEPELSIFRTSSRHNSMQQHQLMDWATGELGGRPNSSIVSKRSQSEELGSPYIPSIDQYYPQQSFSNISQPAFSLSDEYHPRKVDVLNNSEDCDYFSPNSQQGSYSGHHVGGGSSFMSQQQSPLSYCSNQPFQEEHCSGLLEGIDGLPRKFADVPQQQQHHQDLDMDPLLFGDLLSVPRQDQQLGGAYNGSAGLGLPTGSTTQWLDDRLDARLDALTHELEVQIMSNSSSIESQSMSSETSYGSIVSHPGFFSDGARGHSGLPPNWGVSGSGGLKSSTEQPQMNLKQELSAPRMIGSAVGRGTYGPHPDPNFFLPRPASVGFGTNTSPSVSLHQLPDGRLPHLNPLVEQHQVSASVAPATGLQLVHYLLGCAEAVAEHKLKDAELILVRLRNHVRHDGNPMQRLAAYFAEALTARLTNGLPEPQSRPQTEVLEAFSVFYDCIPIGKFGHLTSNQILLDAVETEKVVHVLDLHIWHGMQWPAFLQALTLRHGGPPKLRMSAVGPDPTDLHETAEKLHECARNLSVPFEFCPIVSTLENFKADMVELRRGEVLVVNSFVQFHGILNKGPSCLTMLLSDLRRLNPKVMAFAENDGNHNSSLFLNRFVECLRYYSAVFDAFDASLPPDSPARMKMEEIFAAQKIRNIIACEGADRIDGHETMKFWHKRMEAANFRCFPLSSRAVSQANLLLNLYYSNGYTLNTSECGYLALGWHGMPLMGVSAWH